MSIELDELYLEWLYEQVGPGGRGARQTHWCLLKAMYEKEFVWLVPNDDNRSEDGRELRFEFVRAAGLRRVDASWMGMGCSVLEMLVGLSRRLSFEAEGEPRDWFWHLISNLGLRRHYDQKWNQNYAEDVDEKLEQLVFRTYHEDGRGGLFPLRHSDQNQREVEMWYQLSAYILELD